LFAQLKQAAPPLPTNRLVDGHCKFPVYKEGLSRCFESLRTREQIGDTGHMPVRAPSRRDLAFIERPHDGPDRDRTFGSQAAQDRQHTPSVFVGRCDQ